MKDKLVKCTHCGSDMCYSHQINETHWAYSCTGCGFTANDLLKEGEADLEKFEESLPELYKDLKFVDEDGRAWYPMVMSNDTGMAFIDGTDTDHWGWAGILNRSLTEEEKSEYYKAGKEVPPHKANAVSIKHFGRLGFLQALTYIGMAGETE
jgi:hypothetical protein